MAIENKINDYLMNNKEKFEAISKYIFNHPETKFEEHKSAEFLAMKCEEEGFKVVRGVAGIKTAFTATYGNGAPVISILGEYDALPGLAQTPNHFIHVKSAGAGHGCGHNLLGVGSLVAAFIVKEFLEENNIPGTVKFFGCPAEEGGSGKTFMVRDGEFDNVDVALTWHPSSINAIMSLSSLAYCQAIFKFKGITSHAAISPHLGRSALDAVELMNVGANYLREHVISEARIHYATINSGGISPNVVQDQGEVIYMIRAPESKQVNEIYQRICKIAEGAALMTETELTIEFVNASSNYIPNRTLEKVVYEKFQKVGAIKPTKEEQLYAKNFWNTFSKEEQEGYLKGIEGFGYEGNGEEFAGKYLSDTISSYVESNKVLFGSTDLADVSWKIPTAKVTVATASLGTALHTWQMTAQGINSFAHKGMLKAAEVLALTAIHLYKNNDDLKKIKKEFSDFSTNNPYQCPIPKNIKPKLIF